MLSNTGKNLKDIAMTQTSNSVRVLFSQTEKVTTALYMVTDCVSDREPIRHRLRELSVSLISLVRSTALKNQFETHFITTEITHTIDEILAFLTMAGTLGFISLMNYEILYKEFEKIKNSCIDNQKSLTKLSLENDIGGDNRTTNFSLSADIFSESSIKGHNYISDTKGQSDFEKGQLLSYRKNTETYTLKQNRPNPNSKQATDRNEKIVSFIKSKGQPVSITDIKDVVTDCSEKTIQRNLTALVVSGLIVRTGEKRWARYAISK